MPTLFGGAGAPEIVARLEAHAPDPDSDEDEDSSSDDDSSSEEESSDDDAGLKGDGAKKEESSDDSDDDSDAISLPDAKAGVFAIRAARRQGLLEEDAVEFFTCGGETRRVRHWLLDGPAADDGAEANTLLLGDAPRGASCRELARKTVAPDPAGLEDDARVRRTDIFPDGSRRRAAAATQTGRRAAAAATRIVRGDRGRDAESPRRSRRRRGRDADVPRRSRRRRSRDAERPWR